MMEAEAYDYDSGEFPALYCDASGCEHVMLRKVRDQFSFTVRGVEFSGFIDDIVTDIPQGSSELEMFTFRPAGYPYRKDYSACTEYYLDGFTLEWDMPVTMSVQGAVEMGALTLRVRGVDISDSRRENAVTTMILRYSGGTFITKVNIFEGMLHLQNQLPEGDRINACITCLYSDYWVGGQDIYGTMTCFVDVREVYLACHEKDSLIQLWQDHPECPAVTETYLCPKFELRIPGTGYRG